MPNSNISIPVQFNGKPVQPVANETQIYSVSTSDWFGPLQPIQPTAPPGTEPRRMDYQLGQNIIWTPRANDAISYETLRAFGDSYDLLRMVIETVKSQVSRVPWSIRSIPKPGTTRKDQQDTDSNDPIIADITNLLNQPQPGQTWAGFTNEIMEDMLVGDCAAIIPRRYRGTNRICELIPTDGTKIVRYITTAGLSPEPKDGPAYAQIVHGQPAVDLTTDELLYCPRNTRTSKIYGYSQVEQIIVSINIGMRRQASQLAYYTEGNVPEALALMPPEVSPDQVKEFQQWFDSVESGSANFKRHMRFVPSTGEKTSIIMTKEGLLVDAMDEWLAKLICYAFSVSSMALQKMMNRSSAEQSQESSEEEGLENNLVWLTGVMNRIIAMMGYAGKYEFAFQRRKETDAYKDAQVNQLKFQSGRLTINEWRALDGEDPYTKEQCEYADCPIILNANGVILTPDGILPLQAGGTQNNEPEPAEEKKPAKTKANVGGPTGAHVSGGSLSVRSKVAKHRAELALRKAFEGMKAKAVHKFSKARKTPGDDFEKELWELFQADWLGMVPEMRSSLEEAAGSGVSQGVIQLNADKAGVFNAANDGAADYASKRAAEMVGMKYDEDGNLIPNPDAKWNIADTTRDDIKQIITDSFKAETNLTDVKAAIVKALDSEQVFSQERAAMIAKTEIGHAQMGSTWDVWNRTGLVTKVKWLAVGPDPCPECLENDGQVVEFGQPFPSGAVNTIDSHPNCNCIVYAVGFAE